MQLLIGHQRFLFESSLEGTVSVAEGVVVIANLVLVQAALVRGGSFCGPRAAKTACRAPRNSSWKSVRCKGAASSPSAVGRIDCTASLSPHFLVASIRC